MELNLQKLLSTCNRSVSHKKVTLNGSSLGLRKYSNQGQAQEPLQYPVKASRLMCIFAFILIMGFVNKVSL